jgi:hypothetical protein
MSSLHQIHIWLRSKSHCSSCAAAVADSTHLRTSVLCSRINYTLQTQPNHGNNNVGISKQGEDTVTAWIYCIIICKWTVIVFLIIKSTICHWWHIPLLWYYLFCATRIKRAVSELTAMKGDNARIKRSHAQQKKRTEAWKGTVQSHKWAKIIAEGVLKFVEAERDSLALEVTSIKNQPLYLYHWPFPWQRYNYDSIWWLVVFDLMTCCIDWFVVHFRGSSALIPPQTMHVFCCFYICGSAKFSFAVWSSLVYSDLFSHHLFLPFTIHDCRCLNESTIMKLCKEQLPSMLSE